MMMIDDRHKSPICFKNLKEITCNHETRINDSQVVLPDVRSFLVTINL